MKRGDVDEEVVESGKGTALGEIASIKHHIDTTQAQEAEMKALYVACFPHMRANVTKVVSHRQHSQHVHRRPFAVLTTSSCASKIRLLTQSARVSVSVYLCVGCVF